MPGLVLLLAPAFAYKKAKGENARADAKQGLGIPGDGSHLGIRRHWSLLGQVLSLAESMPYRHPFSRSDLSGPGSVLCVQLDRLRIRQPAYSGWSELHRLSPLRL